MLTLPEDLDQFDHPAVASGVDNAGEGSEGKDDSDPPDWVERADADQGDGNFSHVAPCSLLGFGR